MAEHDELINATVKRLSILAEEQRPTDIMMQILTLANKLDHPGYHIQLAGTLLYKVYRSKGVSGAVKEKCDKIAKQLERLEEDV